MARNAHPIFARCWSLASLEMERIGMSENRREMLAGLAGLRGRVIEVGAGNGLNFRHYPEDVLEVVAVEPKPYLRHLAQLNADRAAVPVKVLDGYAERLPAGDGDFDAVVASLMLCSVRDPSIALAEMFRVLRPGGRLCFLEHVRADTAGLRRMQRVLDATIWPKLGAGCHTSRDTATQIEKAGFEVARIDRLRWPRTRIPFPFAPQILGLAYRPRAPERERA